MSERWKVQMPGLPLVKYKSRRGLSRYVPQITVYAPSYQDAAYELEVYCKRYGVSRTEATFLRQ
jgi:hypothetical protein